MNAETLIGTTLGSYVLQELIGQGTMGGVYLAQQFRSHRQAALKVFWRAAVLDPLYRQEFLQRFCKELELAASLDHPNILPIYEYGEHNGLAYMLMPYVKGSSLEAVLKRQGALPLPKVVHYLEQVSAALDYAHEHGVIHRDLKPANILVTVDDRLLLTDFGLTKLLVEGRTAPMRLSTPDLVDYMAPEQVVGKEIDGRADLYSLGALLYRMVTGRVPFQGQTLMQVAMQHLKAPPAPPRLWRGDVPHAAEQAMLAALAKRRAERYAHAQDLAAAFRLAVAADNVQQEHAKADMPRPGGLARSRLHVPRVQAAPQPYAGATAAVDTVGTRFIAPAQPSTRPPFMAASTDAQAMPRSQVLPEESRAVKLPINPITPPEPAPFHMPGSGGDTTGTFALRYAGQRNGGNTDTFNPVEPVNTGNTGTIKLTGPAKIFTMPVAGQPGRFVTGIVPVSSMVQAKTEAAPAAPKRSLRERLKAAGFALAALLVVLGCVAFLFMHLPLKQASKSYKATSTAGAPDLAATATAQALATEKANIILADPLNQNIHNWPVATGGSIIYVFKDGAYHITNNDDTRGAPAILPGVTLNRPFAYTLTMEEIRGDDGSINNEFGMIIRFNSRLAGGKQITTFYSFEVLNKQGGEYQFWKYDSSQGAAASPWKKLWSHAFGSEFHEGHGPGSVNTFKIFADGKNFTLLVNGKQVGTVQEGSLGSGGVGMLVNLKGTEVAFSNLKLTHS